MVDPQASRFWQAGLQSGLIDAGSLQACFDAIVPEKRVAEHLDRRLARQAIQQGRLSLWQAQQILAGRFSGFKINRYTIIDMIGQGGMGRVYLAMDTRLNRRVALKILSPERMNNPRAIARFRREARVGAQLQHENLVRIYDEGEAGGKCYLVMEYIEGKTIGAIIAEDGPIPPATAAHLTRQVALGLEHAQQKGLIHRDVNPYNILVTRDGVAKLTDLGLAIDQAEQAQVTREGATVGTFDYIAPEQAKHSHSVDTRSDIYSLGCTLYHMLTARVPFPSPSLPEKLFAHQGIDPVPVNDLVPGIPEGLSAVVRKMMRKSPDERYPTPWGVALALEPFEDNPGNPPLPGQASSSIARTTGRSSMTETQVVAAPRAATGPTPVATQAATHLAEAPPATPQPSASAAGPSSGAPPADVVEPSAPAAGGASSRSDEVWADLGLAIDLGPEPSLTEGTSLSRKKRSRSSAEAIEDSPSDSGITVAPFPTSWAAETARGATDRGVVAGAVAGTATDGLPVDVGPVSTLSGSGSTRAWAATSSSLKSRAHGRTRMRRWMIGLGTIGVVATVAGVLFGPGLLVEAQPGGTTKTSSRPVGGDRPTKSKASPHRDGSPPDAGAATAKAASKKEDPEIPAGQPIVVKMPDGTLVAEPSLKSAMQRAIEGKGQVLLNNRKPLRLTGPDAAINISGGRLSIRAVEGVRPVLEVEIKGERPFLLTRTDTPLTIVGVTIVARYMGKPKVVPALIEAGGNVTLERCSFKARGGVKGSRAVTTEGVALNVDGCWFDGFDTAIDVAAFTGLMATIRQSMMVRAGDAERPSGWAIRIRRTAGGPAKAGRRLSLEHCTIKGAGLLHLVDFSPQEPLQVDLSECAILADAILAWQTWKPSNKLPVPGALAWRGSGNQYDIRGKSWIVPSRAGTPVLPDAPTDLASWRTTMREHDTVRPPIRFRTPPELLPESPGPRDFAINGQDAQAPGADPDRVGPKVPPDRP